VGERKEKETKDECGRQYSIMFWYYKADDARFWDDFLE
jgi:hypothetical protein